VAEAMITFLPRPVPAPISALMAQAPARGAVSYPAMIAMVSLFAGVAILPPHDR